jgi:histidinol-phosphate aminotransferase
MLRAVTPATRVVFVANPNNPTGTLASADDVLALLEGLPQHAVLAMDEAYLEYLDRPLDLLPQVRSGRHPNLFLMRTFSKIYGLAGLRVGYGIGHPDLVSGLEKIREPFNINSVAQAGALAALDDADHVQRTRQLNQEGLESLVRGFQQLSIEFVPSAANFVLARVGRGQAVFEALQRQGIIVRPMGGYRLPEWIRVSVGTAEENQRFLTALDRSFAR